MIRLLPFLLAPLLALVSGCAMPSPHFRGIPATRVTVDGSVFDVRVRGHLAEAVRVNPQYAPRLGPIGGRAAFAMAQVSGCRVDGVLGDAAMILGVLDCGNGVPARLRYGGGFANYDCIEVDSWTNTGLGEQYFAFECDPY